MRPSSPTAADSGFLSPVTSGLGGAAATAPDATMALRISQQARFKTGPPRDGRMRGRAPRGSVVYDSDGEGGLCYVAGSSEPSISFGASPEVPLAEQAGHTVADSLRESVQPFI